MNRINPGREEVQLVITAPTRELAQQIYEEIVKLTKFCAEDQMITARCLIGGTDKQRSIEKLKKQPHIVVGTPGRIKDLVEEQALFVHKANTIIVDEADLMLDMGFIHDVDKIAARMPKNLQMLVFCNNSSKTKTVSEEIYGESRAYSYQSKTSCSWKY